MCIQWADTPTEHAPWVHTLSNAEGTMTNKTNKICVLMDLKFQQGEKDNKQI